MSAFSQRDPWYELRDENAMLKAQLQEAIVKWQRCQDDYHEANDCAVSAQLAEAVAKQAVLPKIPCAVGKRMHNNEMSVRVCFSCQTVRADNAEAENINLHKKLAEAEGEYQTKKAQLQDALVKALARFEQEGSEVEAI